MRHRERSVSSSTNLICFSKTFELESLDDLTEIVTTLFSPIPNRGQEALPMIKEHPFGVEEKGVSRAPNLRILQKIMRPPCSFRLLCLSRQSWPFMYWNFRSLWSTNHHFGNINLLNSSPTLSGMRVLGLYILI